MSHVYIDRLFVMFFLTHVMVFNLYRISTSVIIYIRFSYNTSAEAKRMKQDTVQFIYFLNVFYKSLNFKCLTHDPCRGNTVVMVTW